jgi:PleD family two-component response regulator
VDFGRALVFQYFVILDGHYIATHNFEEFPDLQVIASIGVGEHNCEDSFNQLFRRVDVALYQAKAQGRNRTVVAQNE